MGHGGSLGSPHWQILSPPHSSPLFLSLPRWACRFRAFRLSSWSISRPGCRVELWTPRHSQSWTASRILCSSIRWAPLHRSSRPSPAHCKPRGALQLWLLRCRHAMLACWTRHWRRAVSPGTRRRVHRCPPTVCFFSSPARWWLLDFNRALLLLLRLLTRCLLLAVQIPVGRAGPPPRAPDPSGHCRASTASCRSQWALPDLNRDLGKSSLPRNSFSGVLKRQRRSQSALHCKKSRPSFPPMLQRWGVDGVQLRKDTSLRKW